MPRSDAAQWLAIDAASPGPCAHGSKNVELDRGIQRCGALVRLHHVKDNARIQRMP